MKINRYPFKVFRWSLISVISLVGLINQAVAQQLELEKPNISAKSYVLMDYNSGQILVSDLPNKKLSPASLTKMMTSYIIGQELKTGNIREDDKVLISAKAWSKNFPDSSRMFIEVGKKVSVSELNQGIVVQSGNDACVAMAEHIAGSEEGFASMMNQWSRQLGMKNTHFINSHGLDSDNHFTTAYDMAVLARSLIRDVPEEYKLYAQKDFTYNGIKQYNRNSLLWDKNLNVDGIKTGHTSEAGFSLVTSSLQNEMRLIAVVMGANSSRARVSESKKLLKFGFRYFESVTPYHAGESFVSHRIWYGDKNYVSLGVLQDTPFSVLRGQAASVKAYFELTESLEAPVKKGQVVGQLNFSIGDDVVAAFPLVALEEVQESGWLGKLYDYLVQLLERMVESMKATME
jgi:D-alanyl-D-alanine carboxypeptidase (penicillin-binding protein 5/6)